MKPNPLRELLDLAAAGSRPTPEEIKALPRPDGDRGSFHSAIRDTVDEVLALRAEGSNGDARRRARMVAAQRGGHLDGYTPPRPSHDHLGPTELAALIHQH